MLTNKEINLLFQARKEYSKDGILILEDGHFVDCNHSAADILDYPNCKHYKINLLLSSLLSIKKKIFYHL